MGIYIPGMKIPKEEHIFIEITPYGGVNQIINPFLVVPIGSASELPPHGRLGDLDALLAKLKKDPLFPLVETYGMSGVIEAQPTVIPAYLEKEDT